MSLSTRCSITVGASSIQMVSSKRLRPNLAKTWAMLFAPLWIKLTLHYTLFWRICFASSIKLPYQASQFSPVFIVYIKDKTSPLNSTAPLLQSWAIIPIPFFLTHSSITINLYHMCFWSFSFYIFSTNSQLKTGSYNILTALLGHLEFLLLYHGCLHYINRGFRSILKNKSIPPKPN